MKDKKCCKNDGIRLAISSQKGASHVRVTAVRDVSNELTVLNHSLEKSKVR